MTPQITLETALTLLVSSQILDKTIPVFPGRNAQDKAVPGVTCHCECSAEEDPIHSGNYWVDSAIEVRVPAGTETGDPLPWGVALVNQVFNCVMVTDLDSQLNGLGQALTVFNQGFIFGQHTLRFDNEQGIWIDTLPIRFYCCAKVLTP